MNTSTSVSTCTAAGIATLLALQPAMAGDIFPPPWERGAPGTTFQCWTFPTPDIIPPPDSPFNNPFGTPSLNVAPNAVWNESFNGRNGVWCLRPGETIAITIPNADREDEIKRLWVQIKFFEIAPVVEVGTATLPLIPLIGPSPVEPIDPAGVPWFNGAWSGTLPFCPPFERFVISNPGTATIYIDQICIDTICIPAPGATALAAAAGLIAARRARRR